MTNYPLRDLLQRFQRGELSKSEFIRQATQLGVSAVSIAFLVTYGHVRTEPVEDSQVDGPLGY